MTRTSGMHDDATRARGERAHQMGVLVNALLAAFKIGGGTLSGSPSLLADGFHSIADLVTNAVAWFSFRVARRPADADHHYGHGKAEALAGAFVGAVLVVAGASVIRRSFTFDRPEYAGWEAPIALAFATVSVAVKEWLAWLTKRAAVELNSQALAAVARDNRSDVLTSLLVILAIGGSLAHLEWAEMVVTSLIGLFIGVMGWKSLREGMDVLMDRAPDAELRGRVEALASTIPGVHAVDAVRIHPLGAELRVDMEIAVDGELSVRKGHEIAHEVESAVTRAEERVVQVTVHVQPAGPVERDRAGL